jgi:hypothetical protein
VFESNGPDVKVRGTAQTIAEKYTQLGRDAHSSGDNVMAENYFQHAEHYYRIWATNQPPGAMLPMFRRAGEEEFEEEADEAQDGDMEATEGEAPAAAEGQEAAGEGQAEGEGGQSREQRPFRQRDNREFRDNRDNREGGRERFKPRWQQRRDQPQADGQTGRDGEAGGSAAQEADVTPRRQEPQQALENATEEAGGQWEAPSFLRRPAPVPEAAADEGQVPERRPRGRRPRQTDDAPPPDAEEMPQGE